MKPGSIILNRRLKDNPWNSIFILLVGGFKMSPSAGQSWSLSPGTVKETTPMLTSGLWQISPSFAYNFSFTTLWQTQDTITECDGTLLPHPSYNLIQYAQISTDLVPWRMPSVVQSVRLLMIWFAQWKLGYVNRMRHGTDMSYTYLLLIGARL